MSSATPAAFLSAMSMTTTSASDLSATPRATVAPTLPAPPTTVTLRFISTPHNDQHRNPQSTQNQPALRVRGFCVCTSSHVLDDRVGERRRLQLRGADH